MTPDINRLGKGSVNKADLKEVNMMHKLGDCSKGIGEHKRGCLREGGAEVWGIAGNTGTCWATPRLPPETLVNTTPALLLVCFWRRQFGNREKTGGNIAFSKLLDF